MRDARRGHSFVVIVGDKEDNQTGVTETLSPPLLFSRARVEERG